MDYGLLGGIGNAITQGVDAYQKERAYNQDVAFKQQQQAVQKQLAQTQMMNQGYQADQSGNVVPTQQKQQELDLYKQGFDLQSPHTQNTQAVASGMLKMVNPNVDTSFLKNMNAHEIEQNGLIPKGLTAEASLLGQTARGQFMNVKNEIAQDTQSSKAADTIHNDKRVIQLSSQLDQLERGRRILDQPNITNQEFNDYQQEIQSAISGASGGALGKLERTEYVTLQGQLAALKQKITGKPEDAVPTEIVDRLKDLADHTKDIMSAHRVTRAQNLVRPFAHNPAAEAAQQAAVKAYVPQAPESTGMGGAGAPSGPSVSSSQGGSQAQGGKNPQDMEAIDWAQKNPRDPRASEILKRNGIQ